MSRALADRTARERIATELDANLGIEAAAGTGKTTVLVERVANVLATGASTVDELVVITFTEKAAAELSTRVRDALERARAEERRRRSASRLLAAARDLYRGHIETIHSFADRAVARAAGRSAASTRCSRCSTGSPAASSFDAAYEALPGRAAVASARPSSSVALRRGLGLQELREACEHAATSTATCCPLAHPGSPTAVELAAHLAKFREIADELGAAAAPRCDPGDDAAVDVVEGIIEWVDAAGGARDGAEQEFELLVLDRGRRRTRAAARTANWGARGQGALKALQTGYQGERTRPRQDGAAHRTRCSACSRHRAVRRRATSGSDARPASPTSTTCCSGRATCCATSKPARDYFRRRFKRGADRRVPGHRPGAGRARAAC